MTIPQVPRQNRDTADPEGNVTGIPAGEAPDRPHAEIDFRSEVIRKAIHLSSIAIPLFYFAASRSSALIILTVLTACFLLVDVARYYSPPVERWFYGFFGRLLREHETDRTKKNLSGATYVLIAATVCVFVFPKLIAITAFTILIICDVVSALVGRRFGRHRIRRKSIEGSSAFFLSAVIIVLLMPKIEYSLGEYLVGIAASAVGTIVEALPVPLDDNFSVPLSVGATLWLGYWLFLPSLDLYKFG